MIMTHIKNILRGPDSIVRFRWMRYQVKVQSSSQKKKKEKKKEKKKRKRRRRRRRKRNKEVKVQSDFLYLLNYTLHKYYVIIYNISIMLKFVINNQKSYSTTNTY